MSMRSIVLSSSLVFVSSLGCALQYVVPEDTDDGHDDGDLDCKGPELECGGACVDVDDDPQHCGGCGVTCDADETCIAGQCERECDLETCGAQCIDVQTDPANCGMCGRWCESSAECVAGECVVTCSDSCDDDTEICIGGTCACRDGLSLCDDDCVDLRTDDQNCGMCERDCEDDDGFVCNAGECTTNGCGDLDQCEESCTDLGSDPLNCGQCERSCHPSESCVDGECVSPPS